VINQLPEKPKEGVEEASEETVEGKSNSALGLPSAMQVHRNPLKEIRLAPDNEKEDNYL